jgi:hypothetical protein
MTAYFCCDERRRNEVLAHPTLNGIDFLEVVDHMDEPLEKRQRTLLVHFLKDLTPGVLKEANLRIEGGERLRNIQVTKVTYGAPGSPPSPPEIPANVLVVEVSAAGDFSTYTLRLVPDAAPASPPSPPGVFDFDPVLSAVDFSFKAACPSDFDCQSDLTCPGIQATPPEINYLAKDYASFRQLMLDRLAVLMVPWQERHPSDLGIALVELLAYVGDYLSYQQDAVATEAYLGTARRRTSVRRHARLVDYPMHDGRNARVWVQVQVRPDIVSLELRAGQGRETTKLLSRLPGQSPVIPQKSPACAQALAGRPQVFELLHDIMLYPDHNEMTFYSWSDRECCLPQGATRATLRGDYPNLQPGDVLILAEVRGPQTGEAEDADPAHRHPVRLLTVNPGSDPLTGVAVTEIAWGQADALPFPLCISSRRGTAFFDQVSVALGNIVLADHGMTFTDMPEGRPFDPDRDATSLNPDTVPSPNPVLAKVVPADRDRCQASPAPLTAPRYRPKLTRAPLTQAVPYDPKNPPASAAAAMSFSMADPSQVPVPVIRLADPTPEAPDWDPRHDLLSSKPESHEFVVEVETDGTAYLRFGDDHLGQRPSPGTKFPATYRIGNGAIGNIGADNLAHIVTSAAALVTDPSVVVAVRNPLPAQGGLDPETIEQVRQYAPHAFRTQERAVTPKDYADLAARCAPEVQRAAATFRWTGSWYTSYLTVDRLAGKDVDEDFEQGLRHDLERYRMAGQDVEVEGPQYVSLEIEMVVCVKANYLASDVKAALLQTFSNRILPDGRRGLFHPDNFTFGQTVYLSSLFAAAQAVAGVDSLDITKFHRQRIPGKEALASGKLELGRLEIARLDNDPDFPEHGVFTLIMKGGR